MSRPALGAIAATLLVFVGLIAIGLRTAERDRREIRARLAASKLTSLRDAANELANDVEKIGEDLELAAALMTQTADPDDRARELHAIAAITREYAALEVRDGRGQSLARVVAPDAPPDILTYATAALDETARLAVDRPGVFRTSGPLGTGDSEGPAASERGFFDELAGWIVGHHGTSGGERRSDCGAAVVVATGAGLRLATRARCFALRSNVSGIVPSVTISSCR